MKSVRFMDYEGLVSSNWGFIASAAQEKIRGSTVLIAGCGLGSRIAELAARSGFTRFVVADGDTVELSNLNRQAFRLHHLEMNKAQATAELVSEINPQAAVQVFPHFITTGDEAQALVARSDLVVNMVDPGPVLTQLNDAARAQGKMALFPLNIGFGGAVLVFSPTSPTLEEMLPPEECTTPEDFFLRLVEVLAPRLPGYLTEFVGVKEKVIQEGRPLPQLGVAANITASLTVTAMIKVAMGIPIDTAPLPVTLDSWEVARYGGQLLTPGSQ